MNSQMNNRFCDNTNCNGGRAFQIRDSMFCSPRCGNIHFNLSRGDEEYWSNEEEDEEEEEEEDEWSPPKVLQIIEHRIATCDMRITSFQKNRDHHKKNISELLQLGSLLPNAVLQPNLNVVENDENNIKLYKTEKLIYTSLLNTNSKKEIFKMLLAKYDELLDTEKNYKDRLVRL